jgi:O-glycosyl hydrolase
VAFCVLIFPYVAVGQVMDGTPTVRLQFDGSRVYQQIDGFGVNANTRSWDSKALKPALDLLVDSMHASIWRVVVETVEKWEETNDNGDPFAFNWDYYNRLYKTPKFQKAFKMIRYLNKRGITGNLMINFMGIVPAWMGGEVIKPEFEDEYIEMLVSFFHYARYTEHLEFGLISPMNEPDLKKEGPTVGPDQYVVLLRKLMTRMKADGMGDIRYVAPDVASMNNGIEQYLPVLMKDTGIMQGIAHLGLHSYGGYYAHVDSFIRTTAYPEESWWVTEWNSWRDGLDDGKIGVYDYKFASECVYKLLKILQHGASAGVAWEGYDSYYEHHAPSLFSYWGILGYNAGNKTYFPRKHFYAISQLSKFVRPGARRIGVSDGDDSLTVVAFRDTVTHKVTIVGVNTRHHAVHLGGELAGLPKVPYFEMYHTSSRDDLRRDQNVPSRGSSFDVEVPAACIFTLSGDEEVVTGVRPEPGGWYAGDMHVHLNCGDGTQVFSEKDLSSMMKTNDLAVAALLADMGNGEVKVSKRDLAKVKGKDAAASKPGRIMHWDTEWHWDATYSDFSNQALGGHLVLLGLQTAHQLWNESAGKVLEWGKKQHAVTGMAHMQYLNDSIQNELNCCLPVDYPVEAALGTMDFVSEDVYGNHTPNNGMYFSEGGIQAYYRLLNCGFRPGLAAGTDFPCNYNEPPGNVLTYVRVKNKPLTYRNWIEGIREGRTVVSRNAHNEFLEMKVNGSYEPGDVVNVKRNDVVRIAVNWTGRQVLSGRIELVKNGKVVAVQEGSVRPGSPVILTAAEGFSQSGWICARRMDGKGHELHTAAIYVVVDKKPVRASAADAQYFIDWIDNILKNIVPGGRWSKYYTHDLAAVRARYVRARNIYRGILAEAKNGEGKKPILVLATVRDFGLYTGEILRAEGFNGFAMDSLAGGGMTSGYLKGYSIVVLAERSLRAEDVKVLEEYVKGGGNLIGFRPDSGLRGVFGLEGKGETINNGYVTVDGQTDIGRGLITRPLQIHGEADKYELKGAERIAVFSGTRAPAVVINCYGKGHAAAFLYNLPQSIVYTRQGDCRDAGKEMDGIKGLRAMDLFTHGWVDTAKNDINQADEQMRLLSHCIEKMSCGARPLPRFWYFPDTLKCLVVLNNDGENSWQSEFEPQFVSVDSAGAKMTVYIKDVEKVSKAWVDKWLGRGFEISGHVNDTKEAVSPTWEGMNKAIVQQLADLKDSCGILRMRTVANHWFVWCGKEADGSPNFAAQALLEAKHGIGLDANYAHYDNNAGEGHFLGAPGIRQGNYNGSGLPMRFANRDGAVIDVYQLLNNVYDQQYMEHDDKNGFYDCFSGLVNRSLDEEIYSYVTVKAHNEEWAFSTVPVLRMLDYARKKGLPVWTGEHLLDFLKVKEEASFNDIKWDGSRMSFTIHSSLAHESGVTCMLPYVVDGRKVKKATVDGAAVHPLTRRVKGYEYAMVTVKPGIDHRVVISY